MSKGLRTVVAVAASVAIPFVAPAIAGSIGLSSAIGTAVGSATAGSVIGGALTGAALGGASAALTGGDIGRGALMGGIGSGVSGYFNPGATLGNMFGATPASVSPGTTPAGINYSAYSPSALSPSTTPLTGGGFAPPSATPPAFGSPGFGGVDLSGASFGAVPDTSAWSFSPSAAQSLTPEVATFANVPPRYLDSGIGAPASFAPTGNLVTDAAAAPKPLTFTEALRQVPDTIVAKFSDPKTLADMTLRAAGKLAGSALAGDGLSNEERALLDAQTAELRGLQQTNRALFDQKLEQAQNLIGESRYFDPEYFGLQRARREQIAGAKAKQAGLRGLTGMTRESEERRYDLGTARNIGTAYDQGYLTGLGGRLQTMQAGLSAMPGYLPYQTPATSAQMSGLATGRTRARELQADIGDLFGSFTGSQKAQSRG